ncbi:thioredoxin domain-containing protein [Candidatus Uhrbacteria bacterium]|nr:thioredoxin domain-containing protein [Candidatus Uhrbacteria bacterium]
MPHTSHAHEDAHDSPHDSHSSHSSTPSPQGATISLTLSPAKLFFVGFLFGALAMAIPTAIFATKVFTGGGLKIGNFPSANEPTAPSAPQPQAAPEAVKPVSADDHIWGDKNAKVTIVEYSDMECPFCKRFHPTVARITDEYKGKVNWAYRHFPLTQLHKNAQKEAEASECAAELGGNDGFWKYLNTVFERTASNDGFPLENLVPLAKELGFDENKFKSCLDNGKYAEKVQKDSNEGQAAGIQGTPGGFVIAKNGQSAVIEGAIPYEQLKGYVDQLLK